MRIINIVFVEWVAITSLSGVKCQWMRVQPYELNLTKTTSDGNRTTLPCRLFCHLFRTNSLLAISFPMCWSALMIFGIYLFSIICEFFNQHILESFVGTPSFFYNRYLEILAFGTSLPLSQWPSFPIDPILGRQATFKYTARDGLQLILHVKPPPCLFLMRHFV